MDCFGKTKPLTPNSKVESKNRELFGYMLSFVEEGCDSIAKDSLFILGKDMQLDCLVCGTKGFLPFDWRNRPGYLEVVKGFNDNFEAIARCSGCGHHFAEWVGDHWEGEGRVISHEDPAWRKFRTVVEEKDDLSVARTKEIYSSLFRAARAAALARTKEVGLLKDLLRKMRDLAEKEGFLSEEDSMEINEVLGQEYLLLSLNRRETV